jgi:hypothetical protein
MVPAGGTQGACGVSQRVEERLQFWEGAAVGVALGGDQPVVKRHRILGATIGMWGLYEEVRRQK